MIASLAIELVGCVQISVQEGGLTKQVLVMASVVDSLLEHGLVHLLSVAKRCPGVFQIRLGAHQSVECDCRLRILINYTWSVLAWKSEFMDLT
jgi:hypothetical protein